MYKANLIFLLSYINYREGKWLMVMVIMNYLQKLMGCLFLVEYMRSRDDLV